MSRSRLWLAVLLVLPSVRAGVIVVDQNFLGDYTTLSAAVAAATDGDVLLVHPAAYFEGTSVVIDNKTLTIVGESTGGLLGAQASLTPGFLIRNLAPGKQVVIENLILQGAPSTETEPATSGLVLRNNSSHVRVQGCPIRGGGGASNAYPDGAAGVDILDGYSTALIGCIVDGGDGQLSLGFFVPTGDGGPAITSGSPALSFSQLVVSQCSLDGGNGGNDPIGDFGYGGTGGAGILQGVGTLVIVDCAPSGGDGGESYDGGDGGPGLKLSGSGKAWLLGGASAFGGAGGLSFDPPNGANGKSTISTPGAITNFGGTTHSFDITSPLRVGQVGQLTLGGKPNETTLLFVSLVLHQIALPGYEGVLMLSPTNLVGPFIVAPHANQLVPFVAPSISGLESLTLYVQPAYSVAGDVNLGTGRVLTVLDSSF